MWHKREEVLRQLEWCKDFRRISQIVLGPGNESIVIIDEEIRRLTKLLEDDAAGRLNERDISILFGRKLSD